MQLLRLVCLLASIIARFPRYSGYLNFRNGKYLFLSIKNSGEILNKLKSEGFIASNLK